MSYSVKEITLALRGRRTREGGGLLPFRRLQPMVGVGEGPSRRRSARSTTRDFVGTDGPGGGAFGTPEELAKAISARWPSNGRGRNEQVTQPRPLDQSSPGAAVSAREGLAGTCRPGGSKSPWRPTGQGRRRPASTGSASARRPARHSPRRIGDRAEDSSFPPERGAGRQNDSRDLCRLPSTSSCSRWNADARRARSRQQRYGQPLLRGVAADATSPRWRPQPTQTHKFLERSREARRGESNGNLQGVHVRGRPPAANVPPGHKCGRLHGHSFRAGIHVRGPFGADTGWVIDFADIKKAFKPLLRPARPQLPQRDRRPREPDEREPRALDLGSVKPALPGISKVSSARRARRDASTRRGRTQMTRSRHADDIQTRPTSADPHRPGRASATCATRSSSSTAQRERQHTVRGHHVRELPHHFKGTHMSRFIEVLNEHRGEITHADAADDAEAS